MQDWKEHSFSDYLAAVVQYAVTSTQRVNKHRDIQRKDGSSEFHQLASPCCFLRHTTVKRVAKADMMTRGTVMAMARIGPAQGEWTGG